MLEVLGLVVCLGLKQGFVGVAQSSGLTKPPLGESYFVFDKGLCVVRGLTKEMVEQCYCWEHR